MLYAQRIGDSLKGAFLLATGYIVSEDPVYMLRFPTSILRSGRFLNEEALTDYHATEIGFFPSLELHPVLGKCAVFPIEQTREMFRLMPALVKNDDLFLSSGFLVTSYTDFCIGNTDDIREDPYFVPSTHEGRCDYENALINAFKSIEAIIGNPPKNLKEPKKKEKLIQNLRRVSISSEYSMKRYDSETGGFFEQPIYQIVAEFRRCRDEDVAHGSTRRPRRISIIKVYEYQSCAWNILKVAARKALENTGLEECD